MSKMNISVILSWTVNWSVLYKCDARCSCDHKIAKGHYKVLCRTLVSNHLHYIVVRMSLWWDASNLLIGPSLILAGLEGCKTMAIIRYKSEDKKNIIAIDYLETSWLRLSINKDETGGWFIAGMGLTGMFHFSWLMQ